MCNRCDEVDRQIAKYRSLMHGVTDERTLEAIATILKKLEAEKTALHEK